MVELLDRRLVVVTGKGGVGKTTISAALALIAAGEGRRTIVVEVGDHSRLAELFSSRTATPGDETPLQEGLSSLTIDPDRVLLEWVQQLGGRIPGRILTNSSTFQYFAAAAPGAKELFAMVKVWELAQSKRWRRRAEGYDLVILDAPATGHALGMLRSPQTFGAIARVGPVAGQAHRVRDLLADPDASAYVGVAAGSEMSVTETIELEAGLSEHIGRSLDLVVVNGLLPRRFSATELERIAALDGARAPAALGEDERLRRSAAHAAVAVHERGRAQHNQLARLRRRGFEVAAVPFVWSGHADREALAEIAAGLARKL